ncbi:MAG: hypothetical protein ABL940_08690 [Bacteroidia bacterium]
MKYQNIREEELKNKVGYDYFNEYDTTKIVGNIDFTVTLQHNDRNQTQAFDEHSLLWAEAKTGSFDVIAMFAQLILTIGKARTFDKSLPPAFLGAFDFEKIAFVPYEKVQHLFFKNDFNWNVTSSNHDTKEFKEIHTLITSILKQDKYQYQFGTDDKDLKFFIKNNIAKATESGKIQIDKNNFVPIYLRWLITLKPLINFDFTEGKKQNILDSDFYLADLFVDDHDTTTTDDDTPLKEDIFVVFRNGHYEIAKENLRSLFNASIELKDKNAYEQFWKRYKRPPVTEFQNYIIERRDLLVPQDIRERKGAFFTPLQWVELSQKYLADTLGENWQDEYYVWDCAAGTGNLLAGLTNKYNIWASTLDQADVNVMHDRITHGANLLPNHVFQFDFLNDDFTKLPQPLQDIINDKKKRKKLVIYINPPYAEAGDAKQRVGSGKNKNLVSNQTLIHKKYSLIIKDYAKRELFIQFFTRVYEEMRGSILAQFSTLKMIQAPYFSDYRNYFQAEMLSTFVVPADSFDNVKGKFPIGFFIWNTNSKKNISRVVSDVYNLSGIKEGKKIYHSYDNIKNINDWLRPTWDNSENQIAYITCNSNDFQNSTGVFIQSNKSNNTSTYYKPVTQINLIQSSIYYSVRHCISATWLNDRDQFLYPNEGWKTDKEFQNDCLAFTLFSNNIQSKFGINHWIPFTEQDVNAGEKFDSNFMSKFIAGKIKPQDLEDLFVVSEPASHYEVPLHFSAEAKAVFDAGRKLWRYYHTQKFPSAGGVSEGRGGYNVNASLYDIREHFQGRNDKGRMNTKSTDATYTQLIAQLRGQLTVLAAKIAQKVYVYGFLKE